MPNSVPPSRWLKSRCAGGFTLLEIMIVIAIMGIVFAVGVPSMYRALAKDDLARAINDTIEGCKTARDRAILQGIPHAFVLKEDGEMDVVPLPPRHAARAASVAETRPDNTSSPYSAFPRKLGEDVMVQMVGVNFVELMDAPEARARFNPNGTSDEFTVVYMWQGKQRTVKLDVVTGLAYEYKPE